MNFDPKGLIEAAKKEHPSLEWLPHALLNLKEEKKRTEYYIHYVDPTNANQSGSEWQFSHTVEIKESEFGAVMIDILKGNQIGGIELYSKLMDAE
ncbi:MAG: hypothetical protein AAF065_09045 [Verrucomicrobiota bacterium]